MALILALDQGTTSSRSILFDHGGNIVASAQRELTQHYPHPGWVEHDPREIWAAQSGTIAEVLAKANAAPPDVVAVGIANQRETTLLWERSSGQPVAPAIVWQDRRTAELCERLRSAGLEGEISARTGLLLDPYFAATKLAWLLEHVPGARPRAERGELAFGTIDSWLAWQLSAGRAHITDATNASRTLLFNLHTGDWDPVLLELFGVPRACLPKVVPSSIEAGTFTANIAGREVPLAGIAGDQQAALFGQTCFTAGMAKNTYGTGCFLLMNTGDKAVPSAGGLLTTVGWRIGGRTTYCLEGAVFVAGAVVQWLRDGLRAIASSGEVETLMRRVPDSGGVYFVPAFVGLGAPYWDPYARGLVIGLTRSTTIEHIARAAVDSMAFQTRDVLDLMQRECGACLTALKVDGGATANATLLQFQANLLGVPVRRPVVAETTALGAAYLAGLAVGYWTDLEDIRRNWALDREFTPMGDAGWRDGLYGDWKKAVARSQRWTSK